MICAAVVAAALTASAQTSEKTISGSTFVVPKLFTYGDGLKVVSITGDDEVVIYNDDLLPLRKFNLNLPEYSVETKTQERNSEAKLYSQREAGNVISNNKDWTGTWNDAKKWAASEVAQALMGMELEEHDGYQFWPTYEGYYFQYEKYGKKYPQTYCQWKAEDGTICLTYCEYEEHYTGEWETVEKDSYKYGNITELFFEDYDENSYPDQNFCISQTLFNDDENFEYIVPAYSGVTEDVTNVSDRDGDGIDDRQTIVRHPERSGFNVVSEDGTVLYSIDATGIDGVYRLNGKKYLVASDGNETTFYKIDSQAARISKVQSTPPVLVKQVYGIDGIRRKQLSRGINIVVDGGKATKQLVK